MCTNFETKRTTLNFWNQICSKMDLGSEIQKTNVGIRISIVKIPFVPIFRKNGQLWLFRPKFAQKWILESNFKNPWDTMCTNFPTKFNFEFLGPNLPKDIFLGRNFKNLSLNSESTPPKYHVCQFSVKIDNF